MCRELSIDNYYLQYFGTRDVCFLVEILYVILLRVCVWICWSTRLPTHPTLMRALKSLRLGPSSSTGAWVRDVWVPPNPDKAVQGTISKISCLFPPPSSTLKSDVDVGCRYIRVGARSQCSVCRLWPDCSHREWGSCAMHRTRQVTLCMQGETTELRSNILWVANSSLLFFILIKI